MRDVLRLAAAGRTVTQTALELGVAEATVSNVRAALFARLGAHNVTGAIAAARQRGDLAA